MNKVTDTICIKLNLWIRSVNFFRSRRAASISTHRATEATWLFCLQWFLRSVTPTQLQPLFSNCPTLPPQNKMHLHLVLPWGFPCPCCHLCIPVLHQNISIRQGDAQKQQREGCLELSRCLFLPKPKSLNKKWKRKYLRLLLWGILAVQVLSYYLFCFIFWFFTKGLCLWSDFFKENKRRF